MSAAKKSRMRRCHDGKRSFDTLEKAQAAAAALAHRRGLQGLPIVTYLRAYSCPCGKFHFGSTKRIDWSRVK